MVFKYNQVVFEVSFQGSPGRMNPHTHTWAVNIPGGKREAVILRWWWLYFNYFPLNGSSHYMPGHLVLPHSILIFYEEYKAWSSSLCNFLQLPLALSLVCARIPSITIFSNDFSLCSSPYITHESLQPDRTTLNIVISLCFGLYVSRHQTQHEWFWTECLQASTE